MAENQGSASVAGTSRRSIGSRARLASVRSGRHPEARPRTPEPVILHFSFYIFQFAFTLICLSLLPTMARTAPLEIEQVFDRTARLDGSAYRVGRGVLEREGERILPLLEAKARSSDWRERDLARALLLRSRKPEQVHAWLRAVSWWNHTLAFREDGTVLVRFDPAEAEWLAKNGKQVPEIREVVVDSEAVPLLLDRLREETDDPSSGRPWSRILSILQHRADPESAPALLDFYGWKQEASILQTLERIGRPALPLLRDAVRNAECGFRNADCGLKAGPNPQSAIPNLHSVRRSAGAARVLGRLRDAEGAALMAARLPDVQDEDQVVAFVTAVGEMKAPEGLVPAFAHLVRAAERQRIRDDRAWNPPHYYQVREALLTYGESAAPFFQERLQMGQPLAQRALATGLQYEVREPAAAMAFYRSRTGPPDDDAAVRAGWWWAGAARQDQVSPGGPAPLLIERGFVYAIPADLVHLARLRSEPLAYEVAADGLVHRWSVAGDSAKLALALAERGEDRILDAYRTLAERESPVAFLTSLVEATLVLGSPKGIPLLEAIAAYPERKPRSESDPRPAAAELAAAVVPVLRGDAARAVELLQSERPTVREAAARYLARKGDLRALPVLLAAAAAARGPAHQELRDALVRLGAPALPALRARVPSGRRDAEDWRLKLLCEAAALRIEKPELVERYDRASRLPEPRFQSRGGPTVQTYLGAGQRVAAAAGKETLPLLEAAVAFSEYPPGPDVGVFAVAAFAQPRSIPLLAKSFREAGWVRGTSLVAVALQAFGEPGIAAARAIPPPDPAREEFGRRAARHRGATETLAIAGDPQGVEGILAALRLPRPTERAEHAEWMARTERYLGMARTYQDRRLVAPVLHLMEGWDEGEERLAAAAFEVLGRYEDARTVPLAFRFLGRLEKEYSADPAVRVLARRLGVEAGSVLVKRLQEMKDPIYRAPVATAIGNLVRHRAEHWAGVFPDPDQVDRAAAAATQEAHEPLIAALRDPNDPVPSAAATSLVDITQAGQGLDVAGPLAAWITGRADPPYAVIHYLAESQHPKAGPALLSAYRASGRRNTALAGALGRSGYGKAAGDLAQALDERIARKETDYGLPELHALGALGEAGAPKVTALFREAPSLSLQVDAAGQFSHVRATGEFPGVAALFQELLEKGPQDPRIKGKDLAERTRVHVQHLSALADALAELDPLRAHPLLSRAVLELRDPEARRFLAWRAARLEETQPGLRP